MVGFHYNFMQILTHRYNFNGAKALGMEVENHKKYNWKKFLS